MSYRYNLMTLQTLKINVLIMNYKSRIFLSKEWRGYEPNRNNLLKRKKVLECAGT